MFSKLSKALAETNPLRFDKEDAERIYGYKLKHLLTSAALGMMPSKKWSGKYDANGGYLVVKKDGALRHGYASLYRDDDGKVYFKLNLQIRLK